MEPICREAIADLIEEAITAALKDGTPRGRARAALLRSSLDEFFEIIREVHTLRQAEADWLLNDA